MNLILGNFFYLLDGIIGLSGDTFVINFLVAALAQTARVMRPVLVRALGGLALVAVLQVAEVAHEFGAVLAVVVTAYVHQVQDLFYTFEIAQGFIVEVTNDLVFLVEKLLKVLEFAHADSLALPDSLRFSRLRSLLAAFSILVFNSFHFMCIINRLVGILLDQCVDGLGLLLPMAMLFGHF